MSQYTDFLDSYLKNGNTLMELKDKGNLAPYYRMFKGVDTPPAQIKKDTLVQGVGESLGNTGDKVVTAQTQPKKEKTSPKQLLDRQVLYLIIIAELSLQEFPSLTLTTQSSLSHLLKTIGSS